MEKKGAQSTLVINSCFAFFHSSITGQIYPRLVKFPTTNEGRADSHGLQSQHFGNLHRCSTMFCGVGGWVWTAESAQPQLLWYPCSPHPPSALVYAEEASLTACCSHWGHPRTDSSEQGRQQACASSRSQLPPLCKPFPVCKPFHVGKNTNSFVSSVPTHRRTNNTICPSDEGIRLCLLFLYPATYVLRIFWILLLGNCN